MRNVARNRPHEEPYGPPEKLSAGAITLSSQGKIDAGGTKQVILANCYGAPVAVYMFCSDQAEQDKEKNILQRMHHPKIVQFLGVWKNCLVVEKLECSLQKCLQQVDDAGTFLSADFSYKVARDVAEAMCYLQGELSYAHMDIKPGNILLDLAFHGGEWHGKAKVCDFGSCLQISEGTQPSEQFVASLRHELLSFAASSTDAVTLKTQDGFVKCNKDVSAFECSSTCVCDITPVVAMTEEELKTW